jgi:hypothetical protein
MASSVARLRVDQPTQAQTRTIVDTWHPGLTDTTVSLLLSPTHFCHSAAKRRNLLSSKPPRTTRKPEFSFCGTRQSFLEEAEFSFVEG